MTQLPPELRDAWDDDADRPRRPRIAVVVMTWLCILALVGSVFVGLLRGF